MCYNYIIKGKDNKFGEIMNIAIDKNFKVKSKVTGYIYTVIKVKDHKRKGLLFKINNWAGSNRNEWWSADRFAPVDKPIMLILTK